MNKSWLSPVVLFLAITVCLLVGGIGGWITHSSVKTWYPLLHKPSWTPPDAVFAPVWTLLYILMGISLWLIWITPTNNSKFNAYSAFAAQLALNFLWSFLFFGLKDPGLALIDIALLWLLIVATITYFFFINRVAAYLLVPYLLWVSYASALNYAIWHIN